MQLNESSLFEFFDLKSLGAFEAQLQRFAKFDMAANPCVVLVKSGRVEVRGEGGVLLATPGEGTVFGINSLFIGEKSSAEKLIAAVNTLLLCVPKEAFRNALAANPGAMEYYAALCNSKIHFLLGRIGELTAGDTKTKVLSFLLSCTDENGHAVLPLSKEKLAAKLNISRAGLYKALSCLEEEGKIRALSVKEFEVAGGRK